MKRFGHMQRIALGVGVALILVAATSCPGDKVAPESKKAASAPAALMKVEDLPMLDSSPSAEPLVVILGCEAAGEKWAYTTLCGLGIVMPGREAAPGQIVMKGSVVKRFELSPTTHQAYKNLIESKADLILAARAPSAEETGAAKQKDVEFDIRPIAFDALALTVNSKNPLKGLTLDQVRAICSGDVTDWKDLGGAAGKINLYRRETGPGDEGLTAKIPLKGRAMAVAGEIVDETDNDPPNRIDEDVNGIGFTSLYDDVNIAPPKTGPAFKKRTGSRRQLQIDGVAPDARTIASGTYPLRLEVFAVVRKGLPADCKTLVLRDWMLSDAGQKVVKKSGYVPLGTPSAP